MYKSMHDCLYRYPKNQYQGLARIWFRKFFTTIFTKEYDKRLITCMKNSKAWVNAQSGKRGEFRTHENSLFASPVKFAHSTLFWWPRSVRACRHPSRSMKARSVAVGKSALVTFIGGILIDSSLSPQNIRQNKSFFPNAFYRSCCE